MNARPVVRPGFVASRRRFYVALALLAALQVNSVASAQPEPDSARSAKKLEQSLEQIIRFHSDWHRTRKPLSTTDAAENRYVRTLVVDDIVRRVEASVKLRQPDKGVPESTTAVTFAKSLKLETDYSTRKLEFPIAVRPNEAPELGHVDCEADYQCSCSPEEHYVPIPLPLLSLTHPRRRGAAVSSLIDSLKKNVTPGQFYTCYDVVRHLDGFTQERQCRFITKLTRDNDADLISSLLERKSLSGLAVNRIAELTVESSVRVSAGKNLPLDRASRYMRPIYAVADSEIFVFDEIRSDPAIRCALQRTFDQPIFDISRCSDKAICSESAIAAFIASLDRQFASSPLLAQLDTSEPPTPGERLYLRNYEPSVALGSPFFESSQYLLKWYLNEGGNISPPGSYTYSKGNSMHAGHYIFAVIRHSLSVRAGRNGPYPEAGLQQYSVYRTAVSQTVSAAVRDACKSIGGKQNEGTLCALEGSKK